MGQGGTRTPQQALDVDGQHPLPFLHGGVDGRAEEHDAGVVDERVESSELVDRALHERLGLCPVPDVGLDRQRPATALGDPLGQLVEAILATGGDRDRGARLGEGDRSRLADTARGAGDQRDGAR